MTKCIAGLGDLVDRYDAFLVDQFGVILNGDGAYPYAASAIAELARRGKIILPLSNSGRRAEPNNARLVARGFSRSDFLTVLSSGETAYDALAERIGTTIAPGAPIWVHATDDSAAPVEGLDLSPCDEPAAADLLLIAGARPWIHSLDDYAELLRPAALARVPCICSNPDITMLVGEGRMFGAGRVARLYQDLGGAVEWFGKPYPDIYRDALRRLAGVDRRRIVCIGDSPAHDVLGGRRAGLATCLVRTGIHAGESEAETVARWEAINAAPDYVMPKMDF